MPLFVVVLRLLGLFMATLVIEILFRSLKPFFFYKITFLPILIMEVMELNQARGEP